MTPALSLGNSRIKGAVAPHPWHVRMRVRILYADHGMSSQNGSNESSITLPAKAEGRRRQCPLVDRDSSHPHDRNPATLKMRCTDPISANSNNSKDVSHAVSASHGRSRPSLCVLPRCPDSQAAGPRRTHRYRDRCAPRRSLRRASVHHNGKARARACRNPTVYGSGGVCCEAIHRYLGGGQGVCVAVDDGMK